MSKKVTLRVPIDVVVRDRDMLALGALDSLAEAPGSPVSVSIRDLAQRLGVSTFTARRAVAACEEDELVTVTQNRLSSGGIAENSYALTERGLAILAAAREAGIVPERETLRGGVLQDAVAGRQLEHSGAGEPDAVV